MKLAVAFYTALILLSSLIPMDRDIEGLRFVIHLKPTIQNLLHIPMFGVLAFLGLLAMGRFRTGGPGLRGITAVVLGVTVFGMMNEGIQAWVPGRYAGILDMGLNTIGVLGGTVAYLLLAGKPMAGRDEDRFA